MSGWPSGATPGTVVRLVVWQGLQPVAIGLVIGLAGGVALTRVLRGDLYELGGIGSFNLMVVVALLGAVGLVASYWPAQRAAATDPIEALRE